MWGCTNLKLHCKQTNTKLELLILEFLAEDMIGFVRQLIFKDILCLSYIHILFEKGYVWNTAYRMHSSSSWAFNCSASFMFRKESIQLFTLSEIKGYRVAMETPEQGSWAVRVQSPSPRKDRLDEISWSRIAVIHLLWKGFGYKLVFHFFMVHLILNAG